MEAPLRLRAVASAWRAVRSSVSAEPVKFNVSPCVIAPCHIKAAGKKGAIWREQNLSVDVLEGEIHPSKTWQATLKKEAVGQTTDRLVKKFHDMEDRNDRSRDYDRFTTLHIRPI